MEVEGRWWRRWDDEGGVMVFVASAAASYWRHHHHCGHDASDAGCRDGHDVDDEI